MQSIVSFTEYGAVVFGYDTYTEHGITYLVNKSPAKMVFSKLPAYVRRSTKSWDQRPLGAGTPDPIVAEVCTENAKVSK